MRSSKSLGFVDEGPLLGVRKPTPCYSEVLRDLRVVHLGVVGGQTTAFGLRPDHEGIHRALDVAGFN